MGNEAAGEWERGWDGHERAQLRRWAKLPFAQKLAWLEEAQIYADRAGGIRE